MSCVFVGFDPAAGEAVLATDTRAWVFGNDGPHSDGWPKVWPIGERMLLAANGSAQVFFHLVRVFHQYRQLLVAPERFIVEYLSDKRGQDRLFCVLLGPAPDGRIQAVILDGHERPGKTFIEDESELPDAPYRMYLSPEPADGSRWAHCSPYTEAVEALIQDALGRPEISMRDLARRCIYQLSQEHPKISPTADVWVLPRHGRVFQDGWAILNG